MLLDRIGKDLLIFDGAMGTQLQDAGLKAGDIPEELNIERPELIRSIHEKYLHAGADFITTNTFGCNELKMQESKYSYKDMLRAAVANAKEARKNAGREQDAYVVLDIGPIGQLLEPMGTLTFDEAYNMILSQVETVKDDVDAVLFETMSDLYEVKAGILAVKENTSLPVFVTMTFEQNGRTLSGNDPVTFVNTVQGLKADVLGVNCSLGPAELGPIIEQILSVSSVPVMIQPNAGLPCLEHGETHYHVTSGEYAELMQGYLKDGVSIAGGCCGTTPEFIRKLKAQAPRKASPREIKKKTRVSSQTKTVTFGDRVIVCGERLNPTGKKKLKLALKEERYDELVTEAIKQDEAGADVLDVNVGLPGIDEPATMKHVVKLLQEVITLPLQIDSSSADAIEQACRYYNGKPLINSVNGKDEVMEAIFPIVKKYGGVVIGLTLDEGIPLKAKERFAIAKKIIAKAAEYGIGKEDIIIDCLTLTASAQQKEVKETLRAIEMVKELGVHTVLGVSNVSFGLPNRPLLNRTFLALAMQAGLDLPIINPLDRELMGTIDAFHVLFYKDIDSEDYIRSQSDAVQEKTQAKTEFSLHDIIIHGLKDEVEAKTREQLEKKEALELINEVIIPALNVVGKDYETGKIFLPQLIQSAETTKKAFEVVKQCFSTGAEEEKGPVVMATVEGDIHDIGKNIVKVVLESYGYRIIDLGKDVKVEKVVEAWHKYRPKAIGLSALMTTTVLSMEMTIQRLREEQCTCPIWVGGAVLTEDIAKNIGADYYAEDAMASVAILEKII
ncbi:homocysteine S-methyltransferase family protein [Anaerostipes sp.]|uniref:homocysteine S-methyltransferase family protein n=1 Tax=Anaerostipes sp. TaxID=1872530 RepID=UPI0025BD5EDB|nr:homocysteine S-methyltransferase family protein [Anaerostipes sp.]MBS7007007.1 homocysteine S-methyltransferase family protein [Anaerostipes sp.]